MSNGISLIFDIVSLMVISMGVIFGAVAIIIKFITIRKNEKCSCMVVGVVSGMRNDYMEEIISSKGPRYRSYFALFKYVVKGKEYEVRSNIGTRKPSLRVGQSVEIWYNPDNPESIIVDVEDNERVVNIVVSVFLAICVVLLFLGFMLSTV